MLNVCSGRVERGARRHAIEITVTQRRRNGANDGAQPRQRQRRTTFGGGNSRDALCTICSPLTQRFLSCSDSASISTLSHTNPDP